MRGDKWREERRGMEGKSRNKWEWMARSWQCEAAGRDNTSQENERRPFLNNSPSRKTESPSPPAFHPSYLEDAPAASNVLEGGRGRVSGRQLHAHHVPW